MLTRRQLRVKVMQCVYALTQSKDDSLEKQEQFLKVSIENTYSSALEIIEKNGLFENFNTRAHKIVTDAADTGWGFHECLTDLYYQYYE